MKLELFGILWDKYNGEYGFWLLDFDNLYGDGGRGLFSMWYNGSFHIDLFWIHITGVE